MRIVAQSGWAVMFQIGAASLVIIGGLCVGAVLSAVIDWIVE